MQGKQITILDILADRDFEAEEQLEKAKKEKENELFKMELWTTEAIGEDKDGYVIYATVKKEVRIRKKDIGFHYFKTKKEAEAATKERNNFKNYGKAWYEI